MTSKKFRLNKEDGVKILKVFIYLLISTTISFLLTILPQLDLGSMAWLIPVVNVVLVALQKFIEEESPKK